VVGCLFQYFNGSTKQRKLREACGAKIKGPFDDRAVSCTGREDEKKKKKKRGGGSIDPHPSNDPHSPGGKKIREVRATTVAFMTFFFFFHPPPFFSPIPRFQSIEKPQGLTTKRELSVVVDQVPSVSVRVRKITQLFHRPVGGDHPPIRRNLLHTCHRHPSLARGPRERERERERERRR